MEIYKIYIDDREYSSWNIVDTKTLLFSNININPIKNKLFSNDVFSLDITENVNIINSSIRSGKIISGVLIVNGNKTYGRNKKNKFLYKCIPDDNKLPNFLVPYEIKNMGFNKVFSNLYITIIFEKWEDKHPYARLNQIIGDVNVLVNFYEYQLYCKNLNISLQKFTKESSIAFNNSEFSNLYKDSDELFIKNIKDKYKYIEDRTNLKDFFIFTIDPLNSVDLDDAFSIKKLDDGVTMISVYIANLYIYINELNLWKSFSEKVATIYLPDKKRSMIPNILSESLCSLVKGSIKLAFVMDIFIKDDNIFDIKYKNCLIKVNKNFYYEQPELLNNNNYINLMKFNKIISLKIPQKNDFVANNDDSHDVVSNLMIFMNWNCAKEMFRNKSGIFRTNSIKEITKENVLTNEKKYICKRNNSIGKYEQFTDNTSFRHDSLNLDCYLQITSPIRRLVDFLNLIKFQEKFNMIPVSNTASDFYNKWINKLEYINNTMNSIKKIQNDCNILYLCSCDKNILDIEHKGVIFEKMDNKGKNGLFKYTVFLPEIKIFGKINVTENIENYSYRKIKLFLFNNEFKQKIKFHLLREN
jgi:exoribonuclease R